MKDLDPLNKQMKDNNFLSKLFYIFITFRHEVLTKHKILNKLF